MEPGKPTTEWTASSKALNTQPPTDGPDDFFGRIQRQMLQLSLDYTSLTNTHRPAIQLVGEASLFSRHSCYHENETLIPYLHTSHRGEERLKNSQLRSDIITLFDPMDLPLYDDNNKMHLHKGNAVENTKPKHNAPKIVNVNCQPQAISVAKIATKRPAVPPTKQYPLLNKPRAAPPTANSQKANSPKRDMIPRKSFNHSSLQCSLKGDESCEVLNSDSTKVSNDFSCLKRVIKDHNIQFILRRLATESR
jgi:hypothetical protein